MKQNNKGISLVEVIVVVAILGIMIGGMSLMPSIIGKREIADSADRLDYVMQDARTQAMNKLGIVLTIEKSGDKIFCQITGGERECISEKNISLLYAKQKNNTEQGTVEVLDGQKIQLVYNRDTGGLEPMEVDGSGNKHYLSKIVLKRGSLEKTIRCVAKTGKHTVE